MDRKLWDIYVPKYANDRTKYLKRKVKFSIEHHHAWDDYVRSLTGGITIMRSAKGQWMSPEGELFRDVMIPVRILCSEEHIDDIINFTLKHYDQHAVLAYEVSDNIKLVNRQF